MKITSPGQGFVPTKIGIYGEPKKGKTRLATALPWGGRWGDKAIYVAWDDNALELASVLLPDREHLTVVTPDKAKVDARTGKEYYDPLAEATEIASADWAEQGYKTLIWDTMTSTAIDLLKAITVQGKHGNNVSFGTPGKPDYVPQATIGDYGATQRCVQHTLDFLFDQPMNVIVLFHAVDDDDNGKAEMVGGPATVGKAAIRPIAGRFDNLFRVTSRPIRQGNTVPPIYVQKRVVQTEPVQYWLAGIRAPLPKNTLSEFELTDEPVKFWQAWEAMMKGEK